VAPIAVIVEGHGEVQAVPVLLRRIAEEVAPGVALTVARPMRVHRDRVLQKAELERYLDIAISPDFSYSASRWRSQRGRS